MNTRLLPLLAIASLGLVACPDESSSGSADQSAPASATPQAELVTFKIDGMT